MLLHFGPRQQRLTVLFYLVILLLYVELASCSISTKLLRKYAFWLRGGEDSALSIDNPSENKTFASKNKLFKWANKNATTLANKDDREASVRKREFLDRIALISQSLLKKEKDARLLPPRAADQSSNRTEYDDPNAITPQSDLTIPERHIHIVTTAAIPWFTGTSINPLLRAAYMHRQTQQYSNKEPWVTLVVPWLELPKDQQTVYHKVFANQQEQEDEIRTWLRDEANMEDAADPETGLQILFYPARYHAGMGSVFAMGDIMANMDPKKMDVCVLEEPEHCNWFRSPGDGWTKRFTYVIGIVHTNYKEYASGEYHGMWTAPAIQLMSSAMVRAYCHQVIKLSAVLQTYAHEKEVTSNVHGVRSNFLEEGKRRARGDALPSQDDAQGCVQTYFVAKLLWAKGLDLMLEMEDYYRQCTGDYFPIHIYGSGPDEKDIIRAFHGRQKKNESSQEHGLETALSMEGGSTNLTDSGKLDADSVNATTDSSDAGSSSWRLTKSAKSKFKTLKRKVDEVDIPKSLAEFRKNPIPAVFPGRVDHGTLRNYTVFVNPSVSEVLCTTTAEALAMGKFAIIPVHPSNTFFHRFPNCLPYRNKIEFVANLRWAMTHDPEPLTPELAREFTWEAATERFIAASAITWEEAMAREKLGWNKVDERIAWFHNEAGKGVTGDMLRKMFGAGPVADQVKYIRQASEGEFNDEDSDDDEDDDDGLSAKFRRSSFAQALRASLDDIGSFIQ
ncbi:hypothetical protein MPSEU_000304000 [Mayamaea pseudoterrestris]|nr:hypothetical protein MPSEU_000304000 [Mayamaea pseudoterrestris]